MPAKIAESPPPTVVIRSTWTIDLPLLAFWLLLQLAGLAIVALHLPLAASYPPGERLGLQVLLSLQIGVSPALAPSLSRSIGNLIAVLFTLWPVLMLVGAIQVEPIGLTASAAAVSTAWVIALSGVCSFTRNHGIHGIIVAAGMLVAIGGAILAYLAMEFGSAGNPDSTLPAGLTCTPTLQAWRWVDGTASLDWTLLPLGVVVVGGIGGWMWAWSQSRIAASITRQ